MVDKTSNISFKTVFVQGIPQSCSNDQLTEVFSVQGPIKNAFVVKKASSDPKQSTVGYVTYHTHEDAKSAVNSIWGKFEVNGTKLKVKFAQKKVSTKIKKGKNADNESKDTGKTELSAAEKEQNMNLSILSKMWATKCKIDNKKTTEEPNHCVVISSGQSISVKALQKLWAEKKLKTPTKLLVDSEQNIFYVIMPSKQDCLKAVTKVNGILMGSKSLKVSLLIDPSSKDFEKSSKKSRLIIRNLSFTCKEDDLIAAFEKHGLITDCKIPMTANGKKRGYGFVQFTHPFEAERAIKQMNMKEIKGRKIAVDWSIPKEKYVDATDKNDEENSGEEADKDEQDEIDEEEDECEKESEHSDDSDNEDDSDDDDDDDDDENNENSEDDDLETSQTKEKETKKVDKNYSSDVHEEKTLFLRNLSYDVDEAELTEFMKKFGDTKYCKVVENPQTGMSKGCAFVQFINKTDADKCLEMMNEEDSNVRLRGRNFVAVIALDRAQSNIIKKKKQDEKNEDKDKRNIHLANEGLIRPGTLAANGLSEVELKKRTRIEQKKRLKLKNPEVFVSPLRLCVHNIPRAVNDDKLKEIFTTALSKNVIGKDEKPRITESRIMRDRETVNQSGVARSLGFGYVKFTKHEHALAALRELNNNPDIFSAQKRPIVEFSLENRKAIQAQKMRVKRQQAKSALKSKMAVSSGGGDKSKTSGGKQQAVAPINKKKAARLERRANARKETGQHDKYNQQDDALLPALDAGFVPKAFAKKHIKKAVVASEENKDSENDARKRKTYEGSTGTLANGKKVRTMKHLGPKIRKRDKGKVLERLRESKKLNKQQRNPLPVRKNDITRKEKKNMAAMAGTSSRKRQRPTIEDMKAEKGFNDLVNKYRKKFLIGMESS